MAIQRVCRSIHREPGHVPATRNGGNERNADLGRKTHSSGRRHDGKTA